MIQTADRLWNEKTQRYETRKRVTLQPVITRPIEPRNVTECPVCAERRRKQRERIARFRTKK